MKFFFAGIWVLLIGVLVGWAATTPSVKEPRLPTVAEVQKMDKIDPEFVPYSTMCFKGKKLVYIYHAVFYELDDDGKPIRCVK